MLLCKAYSIAIQENLGSPTRSFNWSEEACKQACRELNKVGICKVRNHRQIMAWNIELRLSTDDTFKHPCPTKNTQKFAEPVFFHHFPENNESVASWLGCNLSNLTIEKVREYFLDTVFPDQFKKWADEVEEATDERPSREDFNNFIHIKTFDLSTVWRWMHWFGMKYSDNRKVYYVDGRRERRRYCKSDQFCY